MINGPVTIRITIPDHLLRARKINFLPDNPAHCRECGRAMHGTPALELCTECYFHIMAEQDRRHARLETSRQMEHYR